MEETKITNIILNGDRFQVFAIIKGNQEVQTFLPDVVASDIIQWLDERNTYYNNLEIRKQELLAELNVIDSQI